MIRVFLGAAHTIAMILTAWGSSFQLLVLIALGSRAMVSCCNYTV